MILFTVFATWISKFNYWEKNIIISAFFDIKAKINPNGI